MDLIFDLSIKYQTSHRLLKLSLFLLFVAYVLVGWQLSLHHIFWSLGIAVAFVVPIIAWVNTPWFGGVLGHLPQIFVVALAISLLITLSAIFPVLPTIVVIPVLTTYLAWQEMRIGNYSKREIWMMLTFLILLGLGTGELIDLFILKSVK